MATRGRKLQSLTQDEHDPDSYRKRVQQFADGNSVAYEDTSFITGDSPAVLAVNTDLGRNGHDGYFVNDGAGNILVEISNNGTNYGGQHTIKSGEILSLTNVVVNRIRLTWVSNSSYRTLIL